MPMDLFIDTHVHLIHRDRIRYPWLQDAPALNNDSTHSDYIATAAQLGITHALHMEVDVHQDDIEKESDMVAEFMQDPASPLIGCIASCRPESADFAAYLERQQSRPQIKGFRRVLHVVPDEISQTQLFRDNIKLLSDTRYVYDLCVLPRQLPLAMQLVDHCPKVQFVLDHCGVPDIKSAQQTGSHSPLPEPWAGSIAEIARRPNVAAKISGVMAYCDGTDWSVDDLRPYVEHTLECFGWERVVWGSDSPVCTLGGSLAQWVDAAKIIMQAASESEQHKLWHQNAARIWTLDV